MHHLDRVDITSHLREPSHHSCYRNRGKEATASSPEGVCEGSLRCRCINSDGGGYSCGGDIVGVCTGWGPELGWNNVCIGDVLAFPVFWVRDYVVLYTFFHHRLFRRRFGVPKEIFWKVHDDLVREHPKYWVTLEVVGGRWLYILVQSSSLDSACFAREIRTTSSTTGVYELGNDPHLF